MIRPPLERGSADPASQMPHLLDECWQGCLGVTCHGQIRGIVSPEMLEVRLQEQLRRAQGNDLGVLPRPSGVSNL